MGCGMAIGAMDSHGRDARASRHVARAMCHAPCAMAILAMHQHGQDARGTRHVPWPSWPCTSTGKMPVARRLAMHEHGRDARATPGKGRPMSFCRDTCGGFCIQAPGEKGNEFEHKVRFYLKIRSGIDIWIGSPEGLQVVQCAVPAREVPRASGNLNNGCAQVTYDSPFHH